MNMLSLVCTTLAFVSVATPSIGVPTYTLSSISALSGDTSVAASDINDNGVVVGASYHTTAFGPFDVPVYSAFEYQKFAGTVRLNPLSSDPEASAQAINNKGQVVGSSSTGFLGTNRAATWQTGNSTAKDISFSGLASAASIINDAGVTISAGHFLSYQLLPSFNSLSITSPTDINNSGVIVGTTNNSSGIGQIGYRFSIQSGQTTFINAASCLFCSLSAYAVNASGTVVGSAFIGDPMQGRTSAFVSLPGSTTYTDLGGLAGSMGSFAYDVNDAGVIVGATQVGSSPRATLFEGGHVYDLNFLTKNLGGVTLTYAHRINNKGQILAQGFIPGSPGMFDSAFVLTPDVANVSEPGSIILLFGSGTVLFAFSRKRRIGF